MKKRQIIRKVDTKRKVYSLIPLHTFILIVLPISLPLALINFIGLIQNKISIFFLIFSTVIITVTVFLCSELRFGETGFELLYDLIFHSKTEHIEKGVKKNGIF